MGIKLNPPIIENTLPACYRDDKGMVFITIPFTMNRSVSAAQVCGFELKIKTIQTGSHLYTITSVNPNNYLISDKGCYVTFELTDKKELFENIQHLVGKDHEIEEQSLIKIKLYFMSL